MQESIKRCLTGQIKVLVCYHHRKCYCPKWAVSMAINDWRKDQFSASDKVETEVEIRDEAVAVDAGTQQMHSVPFSEMLWFICTELQLLLVS